MDLKKGLKEFLESIENQLITLKHIDFYANSKADGSFQENQIRRELKLNKVEVALFDVLLRNDKKGKAIIIEYHGNYRDSLLNGYGSLPLNPKNKETDKEIELVRATFVYVLKLHISDESIFFKVGEEERKGILNAFIDSTGKLMIYPYIRHILHMLTLEAGFNLPPIKPIMIKK